MRRWIVSLRVPDVEARMERQRRIRVVANWLHDESCLARTDLRRDTFSVFNAGLLINSA
jgi:hypothetical protein